MSNILAHLEAQFAALPHDGLKILTLDLSYPHMIRSFESSLRLGRSRHRGPG